MSKDSYSDFIDLCKKSIAERKSMEREPLADSVAVRSAQMGRLNTTLRRSIDNLEEELCRFEKNFVAAGGNVFWANSYKEVHEQMRAVIVEGKYRTATFIDSSDTLLFNELGMDYFMKDEKVTLCEEGQLQLMVADMMVADTGSLLLLNKDKDYIKALNNNAVNVFFVTIDRLLSCAIYAEAYAKAAGDRGRKNTGIPFATFGGSPHCETIVFIVNNQRTELLSHKRQRQILSCLSCGRCEEVCPVDNVIGKEPYDNVFTGPTGRVMLPFMESLEEYRHIVFACTMCGRCEEVCPIMLPIRDMIMASRREFFEKGHIDSRIDGMLTKYRKYVMDRHKMNKSSWMKQQVFSSHLSHEIKDARQLPHFESKTFNEQYIEEHSK